MLQINKDLEQEILHYCSFNKMDVDVFVNKLLKQAFTIEKFGITPKINITKISEPIELTEPIKEDKVIKKTSKPKKVNQVKDIKKDIYGEYVDVTLL